MSDTLEFFQKSDQLFEAYYAGNYADALAVAERLAAEYPERGADTYYWRICLLSVTDRHQEALHVFEEALSHGVWWAEFRLRTDSDFDSLQGKPEFERLVARSEAMHRDAEAHARPKLPVHQPDGNGPFPLLIVLGPRGNRPELDFRDWKSVIDLGWMLALPQSSQMASTSSFLWDDREKALDEITTHFQTLIENYPVDRDRIVIGGYSQGAARAIELMMSRKVGARGFIAVVPGELDLTTLEQWARAVGRNTRNVLISGGKDPRSDMFQQIKELFETNNMPLMFVHDPEMAHQIPNDFPRSLEKGLQFILNEEHE